ncbi:MAG: family 16 glycosylhydrolase [Flavisolibacter sp.]
MKSFIGILFPVLLFQSFSSCGQENKKYKLVWSDEFNAKGRPDSSRWNYEEGFVRNHEDQWYQRENAFCQNGKLIIEARREIRTNPNYEAGSSNWKKNRPQIHYTSSCLITKGKNAWLYGRFVMRARIDTGSGLWPAWWTLGISKPWPANGEIDMMEFYRKKLLANIACKGKNGNAEWHSVKIPVDSMGKSWSSRFHIWRMDWTKEFIALYVDDQLLNKVAVDSLGNKDEAGFNPFRQPHYVLVNLAIGGQNGGDPSHTSFPRKYEIDYIRVYQKSGQ